MTIKPPYELREQEGRLCLFFPDALKMSPVCVDFTSATLQYRRKHGGGKKQLVAKAAGIKQGAPLPTVFDATAGFGRDAFILAALGCRVHMRERSAVIGALLEDGLNRAKEDPDIGGWVRERLSLSRDESAPLPFQPEVVYLDPMYPFKKKSAYVKKEMRVLKMVAGDDADADELLKPALLTATKRVAVKRPAYAGWLAGRKPDTVIESKKNRYDIYLIH